MKRTFVTLLVLLLLAGAAAFSAEAANPGQYPGAATRIESAVSLGGPLVRQVARTHASRQTLLPNNQGGVTGPIITQADKAGTSPPLRDMVPIRPVYSAGQARPDTLLLPERSSYGGIDQLLQSVLGPLAMPTPIRTFEGQINYWGVVPPDTVGAVGPNHYIQQVNNGFQIYSKTGVSVYGPVNFNTLFQGLGGLCEQENDGDVVTLHDQLADRWLLTQFAFVTQSGPTYQCIAVSAGSDPLGPWHRYAFVSAVVGFDDYPKYGVWPDAYYMTANRFNAPGFAGANAAFERQRMLTGDPSARMVVFLNPNDGGGLPSDLDGATLPPTGSPNFFLFPNNPATGLINEYKFHVDWSNPSASTFTGPFAITVAPWDDDLCNATRERCIPQPGTSAMLETISDRFMFRLAYRNQGTHESLVVNHTVDADGTGRAGIRWYEFRDPNGAHTVHQQGTFAPADGHHRWMGSIAMDRQGNMIAGYSISSGTMFPSIRYAGRLAGDPPGQFSQGEEVMFNGTASMDLPAAPRWGDYSGMTIDPVDDCTYWYTTEYYRETGGPNWRTRIGAFKFPGCAGPTLTATPTVTPCPMNFTDVQPSDWFYEFVRCLYCHGAISGYADGTFRPYNNTTRGQMTKIIVLAFDYEIYTPPTQTFTDVPPSDTFYEYIETAAHNEIVSGYADGTFRPYNDVTRGQLCKITVIAAQWSLINPPEPTFSDVPVGSAFYEFIETAYCHGIITGYADGTFHPFNNATRAQISKIVCLAVRDEGNCPVSPTPIVTNTATPVPTLCPGGVTITGSITTSDPGQVSAVVGGTSSRCFITQTCPGVSGIPGTRHYDSYSYTNNTGAVLCVTVSVDATACERSGVGSVAYLGTFDPQNVCNNYLGHSATAGPQYQYSFSVPVGATYIVVVRELSPGIGCASYTLRISPCDQSTIPTFTPTTTPTAAPPTATPTITPTPQCQGVTYTITTATATMIPATNDIGNHCDDCTTSINLPFAVPVYGTPFTSVTLGSNGTMQFQASQTKPFYFDQCLPVDPSQGGDFTYTLFADYEDLMTMLTGTNLCPGCGIYTATIGTAPNRQFAIRWNTTYFRQNGENNFEVVLTEGSGVISVIYGASANNGVDGSSGIQRDLTTYVSFHCHQPALTSGRRVIYTPVGCDVNRR